MARNQRKETRHRPSAQSTPYQTDMDSPYHASRYQSRRGFDFHLRHINAAYGAVKLGVLGARDFQALV